MSLSTISSLASLFFSHISNRGPEGHHHNYVQITPNPEKMPPILIARIPLGRSTDFVEIRVEEFYFISIKIGGDKRTLTLNFRDI